MPLARKAISIAVELTLLLVFVLLALAPFHGMATKHLTVSLSVESTLAEARGDTSGLEQGDRVTLYRFNHSWKAPIGEAVVEEVETLTARLRIDPRDMVWPLGRHGAVSTEDGRAYVSLGEAHGFREGDLVHLFRDRVDQGMVPLQNIEAKRALVTLPSDLATDADALVASEYAYATQATYVDNALLLWIEFVLIVGAVIGYGYVYVRTQRSPFVLTGEMIRHSRINRRALFWVVHLFAGIPFVWFMAKMPLFLGAHMASSLSPYLSLPAAYIYDDIARILPAAYALVGAAYYSYLALWRRSPILDFWKLISYRGKSPVGKVSFGRGLILWALHLVIVYAFAWTLLDFLRGDIQAALSIGFPAPTVEAAFEQAKFLIWALTVVGVLIGYGYSVISILWGKYIRNLDFTIVGWLTNGFCYPLFGIVIWQMTPAFTGVDPIITMGPLLYLMLVTGLILNLLYMLSIFNLGTLFDLMTDKGVRTSGFYHVMRHPNYTLEAMMFVVTELVGLTMGVHWLGIAMYVFLYWIRSEREDNFMEYSNPDYSTYQKQTPWKFIPGIY